MEQDERDARRKVAPGLALDAANEGMTEYRLVTVNHHRNGVGGVGFAVVTFDWKPEGERAGHGLGGRDRFVAILHDTNDDKCEGYCAVLRVSDVTAGTLGMYEHGAAWRGDHFEPALRAAARRYSDVYYDTLLGGPKDAYKPVNA